MSLTLVKHKQEVGALQSDQKEIHSQLGQRVNPRCLGYQGHCLWRLSPPHPPPPLHPRLIFTRSQHWPRFFVVVGFFQSFPQPGHSAAGWLTRGAVGKAHSHLSTPRTYRAGQHRGQWNPQPGLILVMNFHWLPPLTASALLTERAGLEFQLFSLLQAELEGHRGRTFPGE